MARTSYSKKDELKQVLSYDEYPAYRRTVLWSEWGYSAIKAFMDSFVVKAGLVLAVCFFTVRYIYSGFFANVEWKIVGDSDPTEANNSKFADHRINDAAVWAFLSWRLAYASCFGLAVALFTWMITFMDSVKPGINPPTPVSPRKLREVSGHTFHMGYVMAILNGFAVFLLAAWYW